MKINREGGQKQEPQKNGQPQQERQVYHAEQPAAPAGEPAPEKAPKPKKEPKQKKRREKPAQVDYAEEDEEEAPRRRFPFGLIIVAVVAILLVFGGMKAFEFYGELNGGDTLGEEVTVTVNQGDSVAAISQELKASNIIRYDWLFKEYTKYSGKADGLQYGDFKLRSGMPYNEILKTLSVQQVHRQTVRITFPEGSTCFAIAQLVAENLPNITAEQFLACANGEDGSDFSKYAFWTAIPDNPDRVMKCEGYLFPNTYDFYTDDTVYNVVDTFYKEFDAQTADLMAAVNEKGTTLNDVVILASFIQEEAGKPEEDYKVSAVFHNRLESTDPLWAEHKLESNASSYIQNEGDNNYVFNWLAPYYGGWDAIPENVRNAYDTYAVAGLPAGAISNPGAAAIDAALNPDADFMAEGYYFFVTGSSESEYPGEYFYAKTADEHLANCQKAGWA